MAQGTIKWYNNRKGFGFISNNESGRDVFVHYTQILDAHSQNLREGDTVEYEEIPGVPTAGRYLECGVELRW